MSGEVDDHSSNQLLGNLYDELHSGKTTSSALRAAQLHHIKNATSSDQAAPYYWAGHRLVGEELELSEIDEADFPVALAAALCLLIFGDAWIVFWVIKKQ